MAANFTMKNGGEVREFHVGAKLFAADYQQMKTAQLDGHELEVVLAHFPWMGTTGERVVTFHGYQAQLAWMALASQKR